jgi:hypothetical protein
MRGWGVRLRFGNRFVTSIMRILFILTGIQEGWLAKHAVSEEDRMAAEEGGDGAQDGPTDPMQGLEGLDVAGPKPA